MIFEESNGSNNPITERLFGENVELLASVTELFELNLAYYEYQNLSTKEILDRTAYLKSINGKFSKHFLLYSKKIEALSIDRSASTKNYFENEQFSTGYATHGLFPYRGKFHPQLIKGLINIIGLKKGDWLLDPMCGSGTANIEAALLGINSYGADVSPFCRFMTEVKYEALTLDMDILKLVEGKTKELFKFFQKKDCTKKIEKLEKKKRKAYRFAQLAFLDSFGYSMRVKTKHEELFEKVLNRYIKTVVELLQNPYFEKSILGEVKILENSDALNIGVENDSIDAVITSPPYSFAIDYAENDRVQLEYLGCNIHDLKAKMIGLKGKTKQDKLNNYFDDMRKYCTEISRVLKKDKFFVLIIGSNTNQTGGIRLEKSVIESAEIAGMKLKKSLLKPIKGMRNTMKEEHILFFQKQ